MQVYAVPPASSLWRGKLHYHLFVWYIYYIIALKSITRLFTHLSILEHHSVCGSPFARCHVLYLHITHVF
ncbi:hypothetical protein KSF_062620 [Reticulibacter mediterranei]|uniref:Uncharacterized protein n=1 Tax=Reticulibacter mediterranei TaxID=2778369 RepID=A0A8J3IQQ9_9CHLR|nr:hypothetical protein KSF_062620 [Reticulibacter mediterranei]